MIPASRWTAPWTALVLAVAATAADPVRMTNRLIFVVDTSGSMDHDSLARATQSVVDIAGQETDDLRMKVLWFSDHTSRWTVPQGAIDRGNGWAQLPDPKVLAGFRAQVPSAGDGGTDPSEALALAFSDSCPNVSIILVTDGVFSEGVQESLPGLITGLQANHPPIPWAVVSIGPPQPIWLVCKPNLGVFPHEEH